ncbi:MAG: NADH pyrophosphatase [Lysobacteraceae bacterium]|nr:MAG: NADH pyrophosphatase [Xanthomonadaceae bacterium]
MSRSKTPNLFEGLGIDRAAEHRAAPEWLDRAWREGRILVLDRDGRAALQDGGGLDWKSAIQVADQRPAAACFLGLAADVPWFAVVQDEPALATVRRVGLREAAPGLDPFEAGLFAYARALLLWHARARFCGACGAPTEVRRGGHLRVCTAAACGVEHYPRIDPAIIVLVRHAHRALLGRAAHWPERRYSTLAGFVEPGESLEDALRREVHEEAGVRVGRCVYHSSQPWPFPASLMVGYHAWAETAELRVGEELADARWFEAAELLSEVRAEAIVLPPPVAISFRLILDWLEEELGAPAVRSVLPRPAGGAG